MNTPRSSFLPRLQALAAFALVISLCSTLQATTYYVATNGNNNNPGSKASPWKTIERAMDTAGPGDTVYIRGGTYTVNEPIIIDRSGTSSNWLRVMGYPGERPVFNGSNLDT